MSKDDERVMCVPRDVYLSVTRGGFEGYCHGASAVLEQLLTNEHVKYLRRGDCEGDPSWKQIIPYTLVTAMVDWYDAPLVLQYRRTKMAGEERLRKKASIGIGGHVTHCLQAAFGDQLKVFRESAQRELREELRIDANITNDDFAGMINTDANPVGQVHLGVLHLIRLDAPMAYPADDELACVTFKPTSQLHRELDEHEDWSKIVLNGFWR